MHAPRDGRRVASAWIVSLGAHAGAILIGGWVVAHSLTAERTRPLWARTFERPVDTTVEIELPRVSVDSIADRATEAPEVAAPAPRGGGEATPRPDTGERGRGGTDTAERQALNLADRDEQLLLSRETMSRLDRSQIQRIRSAKERASREDWRASREPMELTFLANGTAAPDRPERRGAAKVDPSAGAREHGNVAREGTALGGREQLLGYGDVAHEIGSRNDGAERASAGLGLRNGAPGFDHRDNARGAHARPMVPEGVPSVPAEVRGKPKDNADSEQEVATRIEDIVHASAAGGLAGLGPGGQQGPGATGAGGTRGKGSTSQALGTGLGPGTDVDPRDQRRNLYNRQVKSKVYPLWSFPKSAALEGRQGMVIVSFTIQANGSVTGVRVTRQSGIPEFDENCRSAVLRAAPFPPVPRELGASWSMDMRFDSPNPVVRPKSAAAKHDGRATD